ncbi:N-acetylmuramoyl-L-alanine amidase [Paenibacillus sp. YSY-4.3]
MFLLSFNSPVFANTASIYLNGAQLGAANLSQVEIVNSKVMVPIRVVEELGYVVNWNKTDQTVKIQNKSKTVAMTINKSSAYVDERVVSLTSPPLLKGGTSFVPLRFIGEEFGLEVNWDNRTKSVYLSSDSLERTLDSLDTTSMNKGKIENIQFANNRLTINMNQSVQPEISTMSGPDRIVLDLPGAALADSFVLQNMAGAGSYQINIEEEHSLVSKIRYSLFKSDPSTIRIVLDLNSKASYQLSDAAGNPDGIILDLFDQTSPTAPMTSTDTSSDTYTPPTTTTTVPVTGNRLVVIDAGHGAHDNGTTGVSGRVEKDFNLTMALKVEALLGQEQQIEVVLTRNDDTYVTRPDRAKLANDLNADAFISIHANSVLNIPTARGTETYYYDEGSKPLAEIMHKHLIRATQLKDRQVKYNNYEVLRRSNMPATLLEVGFLSNVEEEALLFTEDFQNRVAQGIVDAIKEYFGIY